MGYHQTESPMYLDLQEQGPETHRTRTQVNNHKTTSHVYHIASSPPMDVTPSNKLDSTYPPSAGRFNPGNIRTDCCPRGTQGHPETWQGGGWGGGHMERRAAQAEG